MKPRSAFPTILLAVALGPLLALGACSSSDDSDAASSSDVGGTVAADGEAPEAASRVADGASFEGAQDAQDAQGAKEPVEVERSVIRQGNVELRSADVGKAQFEVQQVADRFSGQVTEEETTTDDDGKPAYTRMVLRIPTDSFREAMDALKETAELESASSGEDDVTAKVIDTRTRLAAQRRSIARITVLFDRAESIRDIMRIESELSRRQAALESLERQAAFLRTQTAMSTITVSIDETPSKPAPQKDDSDEAGFLTGLSAGWGALTAVAVALLTAFGALLPWAVALGLVGIPALLIWRRRRPRSPGRTPSAA
jgi:hypothetical protein